MDDLQASTQTRHERAQVRTGARFPVPSGAFQQIVAVLEMERGYLPHMKGMSRSVSTPLSSFPVVAILCAKTTSALLPTEERVQLIEADEAFFDKTGGFAPVLPDTASQLS